MISELHGPESKTTTGLQDCHQMSACGFALCQDHAPNTLSLYALEPSHLTPLGLNQAKECGTRGLDIELLHFSQALEGALLDKLKALISGDRDAEVRLRYARDTDVHKAHSESMGVFTR